jgi:hypothetical protein
MYLKEVMWEGVQDQVKVHWQVIMNVVKNFIFHKSRGLLD